MKNFSLIVVIGVLLSGCSFTKKETDTIRVAVLRGPSSIAFAQWMDTPPALGGRSFQIEVKDSPEQILALLIREDVDIAVIPMITAANLYNKGVTYPLAGCPLWGTLFIVGKEPIQTLHLFGAGTTPDILARYYLAEKGIPCDLNYTFSTATEITQALLADRVEAAVLSEPFVSFVLRQDSRIHLLADLNDPKNDGLGLAQTAVVFHHSLADKRTDLDRLLQETCDFSAQQPKRVIEILEEKGVFKPGMLTEESISRSKIKYIPAQESTEAIQSFLQLIQTYEPKALGGFMPDKGFISGKP